MALILFLVIFVVFRMGLMCRVNDMFAHKPSNGHPLMNTRTRSFFGLHDNSAYVASMISVMMAFGAGTSAKEHINSIILSLAKSSYGASMKVWETCSFLTLIKHKLWNVFMITIFICKHKEVDRKWPPCYIRYLQDNFGLWTYLWFCLKFHWN